MKKVYLIENLKIRMVFSIHSTKEGAEKEKENLEKELENNGDKKHKNWFVIKEREVLE